MIDKDGNLICFCRNATKQGYMIEHEYDGIDLAYPASKLRRGRVIRGAVIRYRQEEMKEL